MKSVCKQFKCKIFVFGSNSTRNRVRELELLATGDPKHAHFAGPPHTKVSLIAPPTEAYQRMAGVFKAIQEIIDQVTK